MVMVEAEREDGQNNCSARSHLNAYSILFSTGSRVVAPKIQFHESTTGGRGKGCWRKNCVDVGSGREYRCICSGVSAELELKWGDQQPSAKFRFRPEFHHEHPLAFLQTHQCQTRACHARFERM